MANDRPYYDPSGTYEYPGGRSGGSPDMPGAPPGPDPTGAITPTTTYGGETQTTGDGDGFTFHGGPTGPIVSYFEFEGEAPTLPPLKPYDAPEGWTPEKEAGEVQKEAGVGIRAHRAALRESLAGLGTDPASTLARRRALAAHGINIERALAGARKSATRKKQIEMARKTQESQFTYSAYLRDRQMQYTADFAAWQAKGKKVTRRGTGTGTGAGSYPLAPAGTAERFGLSAVSGGFTN